MANKHTLKFWIPRYSQTMADAYEFEVYKHFSVIHSAEEFAEHYHDNHDGWVSQWPIEFHVAKGDKFLGAVSVDREARPHFSGSVVTAREGHLPTERKST